MEDKLAQGIYQTVQKNPKLYSDLTLTNGISFNFVHGDAFHTNYLPFSIYPCLLQEQEHNQLKEIQGIYQKMIVKASHDKDFCNKIFRQTAKNDNFVSRILQLYNETYDDTKKQTIECTIVRNDYLKDFNSKSWLLVQFNLIASGLGSLSERLQHVNNYLKTTSFSTLYQQYAHIDVPESQHYGITQQCMYEAWKMYGNPSAIVLIIHEEREKNIFDQRAVEYEFLKKGVRVIRTVFKNLLEKLHLNDDRILTFQGMPVALVYFRAGFIPSHYNNNDGWSCRRIIELSKAVKIPTLGMQLVNFKIVQQHLYNVNNLKKYLSEEEAEKVLKISTPMWNFQENPANLLKLIKQHPQDYVLKPNREGGGNNIYGEEIVKKVASLSEEELRAYVLMYRIKPTKRMCVMFKKNNQLSLCQGVSEVGLFGCTISNNQHILRNVVGGMLIRTKEAHCNEGGIAHGFAVLDSLAVCKK